MDEDTEKCLANMNKAISELVASNSALIEAVNLLSLNDQNLLANIRRMDERMRLHEAFEMEIPRVGH